MVWYPQPGQTIACISTENISPLTLMGISAIRFSSSLALHWMHLMF
jgi:hypothetical protein